MMKRDNLTKRDLVLRISEELNLVQQDVFQVIQKTLDYIVEALAKGQAVELRNFGVFEVRLTKARIGRNPNKPETDIVIPARAIVKFKSGRVMRHRVLLRTDEELLHQKQSNVLDSAIVTASADNSSQLVTDTEKKETGGVA